MGRHRPGPTARLGIAVDDLIALYLSEGDAEGVRGDLAFAQAVLETGLLHQQRHRHQQLRRHRPLRRHAPPAPRSPTHHRRPSTDPAAQEVRAGNDAPLANADVAPSRCVSATTWGGLAGTWASRRNYWTSLSSVYESMLDHAGPQRRPARPPCAAALRRRAQPATLAVSGDYALPLERRWYDEHPEWFTKPHHDYPAADIPVPVGTPLYAVTNGVVVGTRRADSAASASCSTATTARSTRTATAARQPGGRDRRSRRSRPAPSRAPPPATAPDPTSTSGFHRRHEPVPATLLRRDRERASDRSPSPVPFGVHPLRTELTGPAGRRAQGGSPLRRRRTWCIGTDVAGRA